MDVSSKPALVSVDRLVASAIELHCLGGFVLTVRYHVPRVTGDIDSLTVIPNEKFKMLMEIAGRESET